MTAPIITAGYVLLSVSFILLPAPGYSVISAWIILIGGTMGGLRLFWDGIPRFNYEDLSGDTHFNQEVFWVSAIGLLLWIIGAGLTFVGARKKWEASIVVTMVIFWIIGSGFNVCWFAFWSL